MSDLPPEEPAPRVSLPGFEELKPRLQRGVQVMAGRSINRVAVGVLRLGLPLPPYGPEQAMVLETFGRVSGKRRLIPMGCLREGDRLLVVAEHGAEADWVRNALAAGSVKLWVAGRPRRAMVQLLDLADPDGDPEAVLARMGNKVHAATVHTMASKPRVVSFSLQD